MNQDAAEAPEHTPPLLQFIPVTAASFKQGKPRQHPAVRRHVVLDRNRRDRIAAAEELQRRRKNLSAGSTGHTASVVDLNTVEKPERKKKTDTKEAWSDSGVERQLELVKQHPAAWMLDPFRSFATPLDSHKQAALEYFAKVMVPSTRPFDQASQNHRTRAIFSLYLSDEAAIDSFTAAMSIGQAMNIYASKSRNRQAGQHGVNEHDSVPGPKISHASASNTLQGPAQALMTTGLAYMTRAMRKLNSQLLSSGLAAEDTVIATVLNFLVCEILLGETSRGEIHCQGLRALIRTRGGPNSIPAFLMDSVFLSDMHIATMTHRQPSYPLLEVHQPSLQASLPQACSSWGLTPYRYESLIFKKDLLARLGRGFSASLEQLQDIVNYTNTFGNSLGILPIELRKLYLSKTLAVEHGILSQIHSRNEDVNYEIQDFCIIAALLFIYTSIQKWNSYSPLVRSVVGQLQSALPSTNQDTLLAIDSNVLLWSLFIGAYASSGQITRQWFVMMIGRVASSLFLKDWINVQACLMACYYIDSLYEEAFKDIWLEAESMVHISGQTSRQDGSL